LRNASGSPGATPAQVEHGWRNMFLTLLNLMYRDAQTIECIFSDIVFNTVWIDRSEMTAVGKVFRT
jgi:hypothetical protein